MDLHTPAHFTPSALVSAAPSLEAAVKETLRFYPLLASLSRVAARDTNLGGFLIKKGAVVALSVLNVHMDKTIWGQDVKVGREGGREGGREERREGGKEGRREGRRRLGHVWARSRTW